MTEARSNFARLLCIFFYFSNQIIPHTHTVRICFITHCNWNPWEGCVWVGKCWNHPLHSPLDFLLNSKCSLYICVCAFPCLPLRKSTTYFARFAWNIFSTRAGWVWRDGYSLGYRLLLIALCFDLKTVPTYSTYLCIPSFSYPAAAAPTVRDAWQLLPLTAG